MKLLLFFCSCPEVCFLSGSLAFRCVEWEKARHVTAEAFCPGRELDTKKQVSKPRERRAEEEEEGGSCSRTDFFFFFKTKRNEMLLSSSVSRLVASLSSPAMTLLPFRQDRGFWKGRKRFSGCASPPSSAFSREERKKEMRTLW